MWFEQLTAGGAFFSSSGALGTVTDAMKTEWSVVPFPVDDATEGGVVPGGNSVFALAEGLTSDAEKRAAAEFLAYLGSDDVQQELLATTGFLPTTDTALKAAEATADVRQTALPETARTRNPGKLDRHHRHPLPVLVRRLGQ